MSRRRSDPVDAAFERIVALTPEQYSRLEERLKGWQYQTGIATPPAPRKRRQKEPAPVAKESQ